MLQLLLLSLFLPSGLVYAQDCTSNLTPCISCTASVCAPDNTLSCSCTGPCLSIDTILEENATIVDPIDVHAHEPSFTSGVMPTSGHNLIVPAGLVATIGANEMVTLKSVTLDDGDMIIEDGATLVLDDLTCVDVAVRPSFSSSISISATPSTTSTATPSQSTTSTATPSQSTTSTATPSRTPGSASSTPTLSLTPTTTPSISETPSSTASISESATSSTSATISITSSETPSISVTISISATVSLTPSMSSSPTLEMNPVTGLPDCSVIGDCDCGICYCSDLTQAEGNSDVQVTLPSGVSGTTLTIVYDEKATVCLGNPSSGDGDGGDNAVGGDGGEVITDDNGEVIEDPEFLGPVVTIEVKDENGEDINSAPAGTTFMFWLPVVVGAKGAADGCSVEGRTISAPTCSYYDKKQQAWSTAGCQTVTDITEIPETGGKQGVQCSCTHLTEFAVLRTTNLMQASCLLSPAFFVYGAVYCCIVLYCIFVLGKLIYVFKNFSKSKQAGPRSAFNKHVAILIFSLCRGLSSFRYSGIIYFSTVFSVILALVAYFTMFYTFSSLIQNWAFMHHFVMRAHKKAKLDMIFNVLIGFLILFLVTCGLGLLGVLGDTDVITIAGAFGMFFLSFITSAVFLFYSLQIARSISGAGATASMISLSRHLGLTGLFTCLGFLSQSVLWLLSALDQSGLLNVFDDEVTPLLLSFTMETFTMLALVYLYRVTVDMYFSEAQGLSRIPSVQASASVKDEIELADPQNKNDITFDFDDGVEEGFAATETEIHDDQEAGPLASPIREGNFFNSTDHTDVTAS